MTPNFHRKQAAAKAFLAFDDNIFFGSIPQKSTFTHFSSQLILLGLYLLKRFLFQWSCWSQSQDFLAQNSMKKLEYHIWYSDLEIERI